MNIFFFRSLQPCFFCFLSLNCSSAAFVGNSELKALEDASTRRPLLLSSPRSKESLDFAADMPIYYCVSVCVCV